MKKFKYQEYFMGPIVEIMAEIIGYSGEFKTLIKLESGEEKWVYIKPICAGFCYSPAPAPEKNK